MQKKLLNVWKLTWLVLKHWHTKALTFKQENVLCAYLGVLKIFTLIVWRMFIYVTIYIYIHICTVLYSSVLDLSPVSPRWQYNQPKNVNDSYIYINNGMVCISSKCHSEIPEHLKKKVASWQIFREYVV